MIKRVEYISNIEKSPSKNNYIKKHFRNKKFNRNLKMGNKPRKKFKYHSKADKSNFYNKKSANF